MFDAGPRVKLGTGNNFENSGTINPGGARKVQVSNLTGNFIQNSNGTFAVDINNGTEFDRLNVSGTANLKGYVDPLFVNKPGSLTGQAIILSANEGAINDGIMIIDSDTGAIDYSLLFPNANDMVLKYTIDFSPGRAVLTANQVSTGDYLNKVFEAGQPSSGLEEIMVGALNLPDAASLGAGLDQLHGEPYLANFFPTLYASLDLAGNGLSCPVNQNRAASVFYREGQCYWAKGHIDRYDNDRTNGNLGLNEDAIGISAGVQMALGNSYFGGLFLGYEDTDADFSTGATNDGYRFQAGTSLKKEWGATTIAGVLSAGYGNTDTTRPIKFGELDLVATGDQDVKFGSGLLRFSHSYGAKGWYARPLIELGLTYVDLDNVAETGAGDVNLNITDGSEWVFWVNPAIEFGTTMEKANGALVRPYIRAGIFWMDQDAVALSNQFQGVSTGIGPFQISTEVDDLMADIEVGLTITTPESIDFKLDYKGRIGEETSIHGGGLKLSVRY